jgi:hypothetical protein
MDFKTFLANERIIKQLHLKHCILYRKVIKQIIYGFNLPEKTIETTILNYIGSSKFDTMIELKYKLIINGT